jgi:Predicted phosphatase/phosphohexomutase
MIKLILFDLDGVLIDAKKIHYVALNEALGDEYAIDEKEHLSIYDGLKTTQKLEILTKRKGLPVERHTEISDRKQQITRRLLSQLEAN